MGLSSVATIGEALKFCIFDLRRGQHEGQELEKILFFFPSDLPFTAQLSVIGLSEGLITFTRIFSPEAACEVIEAEMHYHVFYEPEPDIWMVMIVEKSTDTEAVWRTEALRSILKEVHSLYAMFYGSMREMIDKESGVEHIRSHLYTFITDYLSDFFIGKKIQLPNFRDSLKERGTVQMLTLGREAAIEVQSLVTVVESYAGNSLSYSLILFQDLLVSTTLSPEDTINLFAYAIKRLTPRALSSGASSWSSLLKGNTASYIAPASRMANSGSAPDQFYGLRDASSTGENNYHTVRPLQSGKWSRGKDGFLVTDIWGVEVGSLVPTTPTIWLKQTEEKMHLCVYQHKSLTMILLIPALSSGEQGISIIKQQILENASAKMFKVEEKLAKGWGGENAYHVAGYRYLLVDGDRNISRASPPGKVTTLTKVRYLASNLCYFQRHLLALLKEESLVALNKVREEVDLEKSKAKWNGPDHEKDLEISIRGKNNAWVIARVTRGKELYMVLEKANETLLYASDAVEKFSDRYCNGAFSLD